MSTANKPQQSSKPATGLKSAFKPLSNKEYTLLFDKENYMWMLGGLAMIFIGFILMSGGKSANPHEFHYDEIYSFRRITLAPIIILIGFFVEAYAIMKKPKDSSNSNN